MRIYLAIVGRHWLGYMAAHSLPCVTIPFADVVYRVWFGQYAYTIPRLKPFSFRYNALLQFSFWANSP